MHPLSSCFISLLINSAQEGNLLNNIAYYRMNLELINCSIYNIVYTNLLAFVQQLVL